MSISFKYGENDDYQTPEEYNYIDASSTVRINPPLEVVYVRVTFEQPQLLENGAQPDSYTATISILGCFVCREYLTIFLQIITQSRLHLDRASIHLVDGIAT